MSRERLRVGTFRTGAANGRTESKFLSRKLPLLVVRQLAGVDEGVAVPVGALDDLPANLIFGFLRKEETFDSSNEGKFSLV